jgi:hypothetical protein
MRTPIIVLTGFITAASANSAPVTLTGDDIKQTIAGRTLNIDTPLGTALPVTLQEDGSMSGKAGRLSFYLGSSKDQGKWWVKGGRLCQKWNRWLDASENCIRIKQDGPKLTWRRDDGMTGTATLMPDTRPKTDIPPPYALGGPVAAPDADEELAQPDLIGRNSIAPGNTIQIASLEMDVPPRHRESGINEPAHSDDWSQQLRRSYEKNALPVMVQESLNGDLANRWCRAAEKVSRTTHAGQSLNYADADAVLDMPDLMIASRAPILGEDLENAEASCVSERPALQDMARL